MKITILKLIQKEKKDMLIRVRETMNARIRILISDVIWE